MALTARNGPHRRFDARVPPGSKLAFEIDEWVDDFAGLERSIARLSVGLL
jgi:hypothetical protein